MLAKITTSVGPSGNSSARKPHSAKSGAHRGRDSSWWNANYDDFASVVDDEDDPYVAEQSLIVATVALSHMSANVSEKMFGTMVSFYTKIMQEGDAAIQVYKYTMKSLKRLKDNLQQQQNTNVTNVNYRRNSFLSSKFGYNSHPARMVQYIFT